MFGPESPTFRDSSKIYGGYAYAISGPVNVRLGQYSIQSNLQFRLQAKKWMEFRS